MNNQNNRPGSGQRRMGGGPFGGPMGGGDKPKDFKGTFRILASYLSVYRFRLLLIVLFAACSTVFFIVGPKILGNATTEIFEGIVRKINGTGGVHFDAIAKIMLLLIGLYSVSAIFSYLQGFIVSDITQKVSYQLRKQLSEKIGKLPMQYFDTKSHGEVLSRITNDIDTLSQSLNQSATQMITSIFSLIGILIMMLSISWEMTIVAFLILPFSFGLIGPIIKKSQKYFKQQQESLGKVNGQVEEVFGGHNVVKVFNREEVSRAEFDIQNHTLYQSAWKSQFLSGIMMPVMGFMSNLGFVAVALLGGYLAIQNRITIGNIQSFIQYTRTFTQPVSQIAQISGLLQSTVAAAERVFEFLGEQEETASIEHPVSTEGLEGNVSFRNVKFGYNPEKIIINDFSADVKKGQKIAIVGPTGAGKTTIVKLLMRFYDVTDGAILVDGHDIRDYDRGELRKSFGMVLQDTWLYNGTIMENIRYGRLDATDEEVYAAAKAAHIHHFVQTLPDGYNMVLNEEASNVSQGQKQLLTIARAILADPKILILDEATSSVDTRTELRIQKAMDNLMKSRTSFVIAHRLSTILDADRILVMNEGDIIEQGSHTELLAAGGFYKNLYNAQFRNELENAG